MSTKNPLHDTTPELRLRLGDTTPIDTRAIAARLAIAQEAVAALAETVAASPLTPAQRRDAEAGLEAAELGLIDAGVACGGVLSL